MLVCSGEGKDKMKGYLEGSAPGDSGNVDIAETITQRVWIRQVPADPVHGLLRSLDIYLLRTPTVALQFR